MNVETLIKPLNPIPNRIILLFGASAIILAMAWSYEIFGGYAPCPLCLQERWAYYFTLLAAPLAFMAWRNERPNLTMIILFLITLAFLANAVTGVYHSGVEWKWWPGPESCSGAGAAGAGAGSLIEKINSMRVIRCDEAPWRFLWLSFAGYNAVFSAGLFLIAGWGVRTIKNRSYRETN